VTGLRESLEKALVVGLPVMRYEASEYPTEALPKAQLLDLLALHKDDTAVRRAVAEQIVNAAKDEAVDGEVRVTALIHIANDVVGHSTAALTAAIKADALREAATAQRQLAAYARTNNGHAEHEDRADWLDDQANAIDPRRLEGAHP
jgi:hypothetical protein